MRPPKHPPCQPQEDRKEKDRRPKLLACERAGCIGEAAKQGPLRRTRVRCGLFFFGTENCCSFSCVPPPKKSTHQREATRISRPKPALSRTAASQIRTCQFFVPTQFGPVLTGLIWRHLDSGLSTGTLPQIPGNPSLILVSDRTKRLVTSHVSRLLVAAHTSSCSQEGHRRDKNATLEALSLGFVLSNRQPFLTSDILPFDDQLGPVPSGYDDRFNRGETQDPQRILFVLPRQTWPLASSSTVLRGGSWGHITVPGDSAPQVLFIKDSRWVPSLWSMPSKSPS